MVDTGREKLTNLRKAALHAASVEIRRAKINRSPVYVGPLAAQLQRDFPGWHVTDSRMRSAITELAALEAVPVVI